MRGLKSHIDKLNTSTIDTSRKTEQDLLRVRRSSTIQGITSFYCNYKYRSCLIIE